MVNVPTRYIFDFPNLLSIVLSLYFWWCSAASVSWEGSSLGEWLLHWAPSMSVSIMSSLARRRLSSFSRLRNRKARMKMVTMHTWM